MATQTPNTLVFVTPKRLSDGSIVHNVCLGEHVWCAVSEDDANEMAEKIVDAINEHTNDLADTVIEG